jgi:hypothetical protein
MQAPLLHYRALKMDPLDPADAQQIVIEYARVLERDLSANRHPARIDSLPYAKPLIKSAIQTSARAVTSSGQLTDDLREFLQTAYVSLAEYVDGELVQLLAQYRASAAELAADTRRPTEKTTTPAWRTLVDSGTLVADVARAIATEARTLETEFEQFIHSHQT